MKQVTAQIIAHNAFCSLGLERAFDSNTCGVKAALCSMICRANKAMSEVVNNFPI